MFYPVKNHEVQPSGCRPYKGRAASFLNGLETFLKKRLSIDFITIMLSQMFEICIREKHFRCKSFWLLSKCSHFLNISCILKPFFA